MRKTERIGWLCVIGALLLLPAAGRSRHSPKPGAGGDLLLTLPLSASGALPDGRKVTVSGSLTVTVPALPSPLLPVLTAASLTVRRGTSLGVSWSGLTGPSPTDWIGLFPQGSASADATLKSWLYTNGMAAGSISLPIPSVLTPGPYELRLFRANGWTLAMTGPVVMVTGETPTPTPPHLLASPPILDWGTFYLDKTHAWDDRMVTLTNDGGGALTGSVGTIKGSDFSFTIRPAAPFSLSTGQIQVLGVRFSPTTAGAKSGSLPINSSDARGSVSVPLSGVAMPLPAPLAKAR